MPTTSSATSASNPLPPLQSVSVEPPFGMSPSASGVDPLRCRIVRQITAEMVLLVGERVAVRRDRRRAASHVRQISMYVCHVVLQMSLTDIGLAFGRDRTTVGYACNVVEDRRDDRAYDEFVAAIERVVVAVFGAASGSAR